MVTDFDLVVKIDSVGGLTIALPRSSDFMNNVCGICGDFDDDSGNDWIIGPYTPCDETGATQGQQVCDRILRKAVIAINLPQFRLTGRAYIHCISSVVKIL